jgi:acyl-CoA thioesterase
MTNTAHSDSNDQPVKRGTFGPHDHPILGVDKAADWLGITISEYAEGYAKGHMTIRPEMLNGFDIAHGGMLFAFADTLFAWACNNPDGDGTTISVTQGSDIHFIASAPVDTPLTAVGRRHETTGRSGLCDVTITDDHGAIIAEFRGRFRTIPRTPRG